MLEFTVGTDKTTNLRKIFFLGGGFPVAKCQQFPLKDKTFFFFFKVGKEKKTLVIFPGEHHFIIATVLFYAFWQAGLDKQ